MSSSKSPEQLMHLYCWICINIYILWPVEKITNKGIGFHYLSTEMKKIFKMQFIFYLCGKYGL